MVEVNIGAAANDGTGDPLRTAFAKVNADISSVKSEILSVRETIASIEELPSLDAIMASEQVSVAAAEQATEAAEIVDAALEARSNAIFYVGDSNGGQTCDVVIASPAFVSENNTLPYPTVTVEIENGVVKSLLEAGAAEIIMQAKDDAETSAAQSAMYDGIRLPTVTALLADTALTYVGGGPSSVASGDFISTKAEGFRYQVIPSGATDQHMTTAGGVKLKVLAGNGPVNVRAFGAKGDSVTNDYAAINTAINAFGNVYIPEGTFMIGSTLTFDNVKICGAGPTKTRLRGMSAVLPANQAILKLGRTTVLESLRIEYDTLTGTEGRWERVGLDTRGAQYPLQRGSKIDKLRFSNCGTAICDVGGGCFSVTFGTLEIASCSYAFMDISAFNRTGNIYENIYCGGSSYAMKYGIVFEGLETGGMMGQINVEHAVFQYAAVKLQGLIGTKINGLNIEGTDLSQADAALLEINSCSVQIDTLNVLNTRQEVDGVSFIKLGTADTGTGNRQGLPKVKIGVLHLTNLANANLTLYPNARRNLSLVSGWKFIRCDDTSRNWKIEVDEYKWSCPLSAGSDVIMYSCAESWYSDSDNFTLLRWSRKGLSMPAGENFIKNPLLKNWVNTSALVNTTTDIETASGWFASTSTGALAVSRQFGDFGKDAATFIRMSNVGTVGTYQDIYQDIAEFRFLFDEPLVLSFDARADVSGRAFASINLAFYNTGGSPSYIYRQASAGGNIFASLNTSWRRHSIKIPTFLSSQVATFGAAPFFKLSFQINDATPDRERVIDLRNVKLERGTEETRFGALIN